MAGRHAAALACSCAVAAEKNTATAILPASLRRCSHGPTMILWLPPWSPAGSLVVSRLTCLNRLRSGLYHRAAAWRRLATIYIKMCARTRAHTHTHTHTERHAYVRMYVSYVRTYSLSFASAMGKDVLSLSLSLSPSQATFLPVRDMEMSATPTSSAVVVLLVD